MQQQYVLGQKNLMLQKRQLYPNLTFGYSNMSMYGTGADNQFYGYSKRFGSTSIGINVPIFAHSQMVSIAAQRIKIEQLQQQIESENTIIALKIKELNAAKIAQQNKVDYFVKTGLKNATIIINTANNQFVNGEINYLDMTLLLNNAIKINSDYLDAIDALNQITISILSITNN